MKRLVKSLFVFALILTVLVGCSSNSGTKSNSSKGNKQSDMQKTTAKSGGTVTIAQVSEPDNLNPMIFATTSDTDVTDMIFDSLVVPDKKLKMVGDLAKSWDVSPDGKTYTFHLRQGVKWQDGQPFTADDVAFTFTSLADPGYDAGAYYRVSPIVGAQEYHDKKASSVSGIKVIDKYTISFTTKTKFAPFISGLYIGILPKHLLKDVPPSQWAKDKFNRAPVGTGPFKFVKWEKGQYIELQANKDYFQGAPKLDKIIVRFGDANTMLAAFLNKEVDIAPVPVSEVSSVKGVPFANLKLMNALNVYYLGFNLKNDMFKDANVRKALAYAIDKKSIVNSVLGQYGKVSDDVFPSQHWSHDPNVPKYNYDPQKAEQLLQQAGYKKDSKGIYAKNGKEFKFTLEVPTGNKEREKTAVLLKQQFKAVGVDMELQSLDFPTLVTKLLPKTADGKQRPVTKDDYQAYILGFGIEADPDEYRTYFGSKYMPPNGYNFVGYSDSTMDKLLEEQAQEVDFQKRKALIWKVGDKLAQDEVWIPLYEQSYPYAANKKIQGFDPDFRGVTFNAKDWSLSE